MLFKFIILLLLPIIIAYSLLFFVNIERLPPKIENDDYFGPGSIHSDDVEIYDYEIHIDPSRIKAFKDGWKNVDLDSLINGENNNFKFGLNYGYLKELNESVQKYDWDQHQCYLNTFKQYR